MTEPERQPLLSQTPVEQQSPRCRVGCLMVVIFLQLLSSNGIVNTLDADLRIFDIDIKEISAFLVGGSVFLYILPVCIGLYADVIVGKYTALFFGLCLKVLGALLTFFVVLRLEVWPEVDPITRQVLVAVFAASVIMLCIGVCTIVPTLLSLGSQQINQQTESQASFIRWCLMTIVAGAVTEFFLWQNDIPYSPPLLTHHPQSIRHAASLTLDVLTLAIFLFGKPFYIKPLPTEGRESLQSWLQIARNQIKCLPSRRHYDTIDVQDIVRSCHLERLRIRKGVITIPLFSAVASSFVAFIVLDGLTVRNVLVYHPGKLDQVSLVRNIRWAAFLTIVPLMELTIRKCGHHLWQNNLTNQLKALGFGMLLSIIYSLTAGVVASILPHRDYFGASVMYIIPQYILYGLASFVTYSSALTFCLTECPTGLSTFVLLLCMSFCFLAFPLWEFVDAETDLKHIVAYTDVFCYVTAAVLSVILVLIYIPVSIWYVKASRAIEIELEEQENSKTDNNTRPMYSVT